MYIQRKRKENRVISGDVCELLTRVFPQYRYMCMHRHVWWTWPVAPCSNIFLSLLLSLGRHAYRDRYMYRHAVSTRITYRDIYIYMNGKHALRHTIYTCMHETSPPP